MMRMHRELRQKGYRFGILHVEAHNYGAQLFYSSMGYRVVDTTMMFTKGIAG